MALAFPINARLLQPSEVATRFVKPAVYDDVLSVNHVLIQGPRGSGKTTLLSMLTQPAQRVWLGRHPDEPPINYLGVLVRADLTWSRQLRSLGRQQHETDRGPLLRYMYSNQCAVAMIRALRDLLRDLEGQPGGLARRAALENALTATISIGCRLDAEEISTLTDARLAMRRRVEEAWDAARSARFSPHELPAIPSPQHIDIFGVASAVAEVLDEHELFPALALLFDELELVPVEVRHYLRSGLRDADSRVLLKMSISPVEGSVSDLSISAPASAGQDFVPVDLTYPSKTEGYEFTSSLLVELGRQRGWRADSAATLLGYSRFDRTPTRDLKIASYQKRGDVLEAFKSLSRDDASFAAYLDRMGVDLEQLTSMLEIDRAASLRKVRDLVLVRQAYRRANSDPRYRRGAKSLAFFAGHESVLALLEGNPRWVVNFMSEAAGSATSGQGRIRPVRQAHALAEVLASVRSRVGTSPLPVDSVIDVDPTRGQRTLALLDNIGTYLRRRVIVDDFDPDPPLTFVVDKGVDVETASLISDAVQHGAVIHVPSRDLFGPFRNVYGQRFRLAYLLAASYQLPPILGREINLSSILSTQKSGPPEMAPLSDLRLFT